MAKEHKRGELHNAAVKLGHHGGVKGGPARDRALTSKRKQEIARKGGKSQKS
jgi:general stress protein YciG